MKIKKFGAVISVCAAVCLTFGLFACSAGGGETPPPAPPAPPAEKQSYDITFDANGGKFSDGSLAKTVKTDEDTGKVTPPADPVRDEYTFSFWGESGTAAAAAAIDFTTKTFSANATIYAVWQEVETYPDSSEWNLDLQYEEVKEGDDITGYIVHSKGDIPADGKVVIAEEYQGKPVVGIKADGFSEWRGSLKEIYIPEGVKEIGDRAFYECDKLAEVKIPASVTAIASSAFWQCSALKKLVFSGGSLLESIGTHAFDGAGITSLSLPQGLKSIGDGAFFACNGLTAAALPASLESLGASAFADCENLASVELGGGLDKVESEAFKNCTALSSVVLPDGITEIASGAFEGCAALESVDLPSDLDKLGKHAFAGTGLKQVTLPASLRTSGDAIFADCADLGKIEVEVGNENFYVESDCLIMVYNKKTAYKVVASYAKGALTVPEDSKNGIKIGEEAFAGCAITSIYIPASCDYIGFSPFKNCRLLENIEVADGNEFYISKGNCLIDHDLGYLLGGCKTSVIPADEGVQIISPGAFAGCDIASVIIPAGVNEIGNFAFMGCGSLTSITYGGTRNKWDTMTKGESWEPSCAYTVTCSDD